MKHLVGCVESEPLSGPVIQYFFDHSQFIFGDRFHAPLLGNVWRSYQEKILTAAAQPTLKRIGKVGLVAQGLIDRLVIGKRPFVVHCLRPHS